MTGSQGGDTPVRDERVLDVSAALIVGLSSIPDAYELNHRTFRQILRSEPDQAPDQSKFSEHLATSSHGAVAGSNHIFGTPKPLQHTNLT